MQSWVSLLKLLAPWVVAGLGALAGILGMITRVTFVGGALVSEIHTDTQKIDQDFTSLQFQVNDVRQEIRQQNRRTVDALEAETRIVEQQVSALEAAVGALNQIVLNRTGGR